MRTISRAEDPVLIVKSQFARFCLYAVGDLIRPAHNNAYQ